MDFLSVWDGRNLGVGTLGARSIKGKEGLAAAVRCSCRIGVWGGLWYDRKKSIQQERIEMAGNGKLRSDVKPGLEVDIVLKQDQRTGKLTRGIVKDLLTNSPQHPHGIKVRLQDGQVGRVQNIVGG